MYVSTISDVHRCYLEKRETEMMRDFHVFFYTEMVISATELQKNIPALPRIEPKTLAYKAGEYTNH